MDSTNVLTFLTYRPKLTTSGNCQNASKKFSNKTRWRSTQNSEVSKKFRKYH